jgi:CheY-like chemotaxis protein
VARILVVEDEEDIREPIADLLRARGYDVATACDGVEALAQLRREGHGVALILLDLMMPEVDGWTFRRHQLADAATASIPVVIMSAVHEVRDAAASLRVTDILPKPIELETLMSMVRRYLTP